MGPRVDDTGKLVKVVTDDTSDDLIITELSVGFLVYTDIRDGSTYRTEEDFGHAKDHRHNARNDRHDGE